MVLQDLNIPLEFSSVFHGDRHGQGMASFERGNAVKELLETCAVMIDIEFVDEAAIGQADGDAVTGAARTDDHDGVRSCLLPQKARPDPVSCWWSCINARPDPVVSLSSSELASVSSPAELIRTSDIALYEAKRCGRNQIVAARKTASVLIA